MLTPAEFNTLLGALGEPVTFSQAKPPAASTSVRAIIQDMGRAPEAVANAYGLTGRTVQLAASAFTVPPEKFDAVIRSNGERITLDIVNPEHERGNGTVAYYVAYGKVSA